MKNLYGRIGATRLLNIKVVANDTLTIYEGMIEDAPQEIKDLRYSKIEMGAILTHYVYTEFNPTLQEIIDKNK